MVMRRVLLLLTLLFSTVLSAQRVDPIAEMDKMFSRYGGDSPGVTVAVSKGGEMIYHKGFGMANLEWSVPIDTNTIFEAGSCSKQFVAASILLLAKEGALSLGDDVRLYIPELPDYGSKITVDMLISHTSGLKDWGALFSIASWPRSSSNYTIPLAVEVICNQSGLNFLPGSKYLYSNSNYILMVAIVERITGLTLQQFTERNFFEPLGMTNTRWRDNFRDIIPRRAKGYTIVDEDYLLSMPYDNVYGAGALLTTVGDLIKWNSLYRDYQILGELYSENRITPRLLNSGQPTKYGAGLSVDYLKGNREISHSGATAGYRAWLAWYPEEELSVAILSNWSKFAPRKNGRDVASLFLKRRDGAPSARPAVGAKPIIPDSGKYKREPLSSYAGRYYSKDLDKTFTISVIGKRLRLVKRVGSILRMNRVNGDEFKHRSTTYHFERDEKGEVVRMRITTGRAFYVPFEKID